MKVSLKDGAPRSTGSVDINVSKSGNTLEIGAVGVEPPPIVLEFYDGKLSLRLYDAAGGLSHIQRLDVTPTVKPEPATKPDPLNVPLVAANPATKQPSAQETVNSVFPTPAPFEPTATDDDLAAFDAA